MFYVDVTGLVILYDASEEAVAAFAEFCHRRRISIIRIIAAHDAVVSLHRSLSRLNGCADNVCRRFPEWGMMVVPEKLRDDAEPRLRLAYPHDVEKVAKGAVLAMAEELGLETRDEDLDRLLRSKKDLIERGRYYVLEVDGTVLFQAYLSAKLPEVSQIQGVWVPPDYRGKGVATRCLTEMARRCLGFSDRLVLRVQKRNKPAEAVYRKVGFQPFMDYLSVWYETGTSSG